MRRVLLLCASHNDLGLINALRKLDCYIYAAGNIPGLIGEKYVDEYIKADYSDKELILKIARELNVDNICACCNDYGVYTAAYAAEKLGLDGYDPYETTLTLNNKDRFKKFAEEHDLLTPRARSFSDKADAEEYAAKCSMPVMVKPSDCSAGNGITKASNINELKKAIEYAFEKSRNGNIVIEPYIEGTQHGFCTFLHNRKVVASCSNDEYSVLNPYRVEIDTFPAVGIERCEKILIQQIEKIADILNLKDGIFHLQYIEDKEGPHIIEVMRRVLGNMYSVPANAYNGFEWDYWEARARLGLSCDRFPFNMPKGGYFAYKTLLAEKNGIIKEINIPQKYDRYITGSCILKKTGDEITRYLSEPVGFLFMRFPSMDKMLEVLVKDYSNGGVKIIGE